MTDCVAVERVVLTSVQTMSPPSNQMAKSANPALRIEKTSEYTASRNTGCTIDQAKPSTEFL